MYTVLCTCLVHNPKIEMFSISGPFFQTERNPSLPQCMDAVLASTLKHKGSMPEDIPIIVASAESLVKGYDLQKDSIALELEEDVRSILYIENLVADGRKTLTPEEYGQFKRAVNSVLSRYRTS